MLDDEQPHHEACGDRHQQVSACTDGGAFHCYKPDPAAVLNFLGQYTLNNTPTHINITTDESKSYYWLDIDQTGGEHWTQVEVTKTGFDITASISDTNQLTLGFNLGAGAITDIIPQPGLGLPPGIYSIKGGGNDTIAVYTSGYLPVTVSSATSPLNLTISLIDGGEKVYLPIVIKNK